MDTRQNPLILSLYVGRWFQADVRVSLWMILIILVLCTRMGVSEGLWIFLILSVSLLLHELAHVFAARKTGGQAHEILIWPLGGLSMPTPAPTFFSECWTIAAGPLMNLLICLICLPEVISSGKFAESINLLALPAVTLEGHLVKDLILLAFSINSKLFVLNCLPIHPLDGGQMAYCIGRQYWDRTTARVGALRIGVICCIALWFIAALCDSTELILVQSLLFMMCVYEFFAAQLSPQTDDAFLGYDFSEGYSSLDDSARENPKQPGPFARWKQQRELKRQEQEEQLRIETEKRVDELLDKVHHHGMNSLTDEESQFLKQASSRYRGSK